MKTQYQEVFDELDAFVKSHDGKRTRFSARSQEYEDGEMDPAEHMRTLHKMLARLDTPEGQKGLTTTEILTWRSMIREKIEQLQKITGDTTELELVGKSLGFGMALGSKAAHLGVQIAQNFQGRVSTEYLSWFAKNPIGA